MDTSLRIVEITEAPDVQQGDILGQGRRNSVMRTLCAPELHHLDSSWAPGNGGDLTVTTQPARPCLCMALSTNTVPAVSDLLAPDMGNRLSVNGMGTQVMQGLRPSFCSGLSILLLVPLVTQRSL